MSAKGLVDTVVQFLKNPWKVRGEPRVKEELRVVRARASRGEATPPAGHLCRPAPSRTPPAATDRNPEKRRAGAAGPVLVFRVARRDPEGARVPEQGAAVRSRARAPAVSGRPHERAHSGEAETGRAPPCERAARIRSAGPAITPHAERDRIYDIRYFHRDHRRDRDVETKSVVDKTNVRGAGAAGPDEVEGMDALFPGAYYKAGVKKHILDHKGAGYQA